MTQHTESSIGAGHIRVEGPLKVTGRARYAADHGLPGMLHAVPVCATVGKGRILGIETGVARGMPGVRKVYTRENIGRFPRVDESAAKLDEYRPPMEDDEIRYYGQYVALVVADTLEQAMAAAAAVAVQYDAQTPDVSMDLAPDDEPRVDTERGDAPGAYAQAGIRIDHTYTTPPETNNPLEMHATVAVYDGRAFTLYESSQGIVNHRVAMARMLDVPEDSVRVVTEHVGSGFGSKLWPWGHSLLAAAAARDLGSPVKLVLSRRMMFHNVGHRSNTSQRVRLSATRDGRLTSLRHDYLFHVAMDEYHKENCGEATGFLYSTPNLRAAYGSARRNIAPTTSMRGPGAVPGLYAIESAMDELAIELGMDPVELRLRNEPEQDEAAGLPFSSRHLRECLLQGAERFGWARRDPRVGSMRRDGLVLGWGMAACSWMAVRLKAQASVALRADGTARVASATQDIGTGTYTVMAQMAGSVLGLPPDRIEVALGDTALPPGPTSGGSMATGSLVPAVLAAARDAVRQLAACAARAGLPQLAGVAADDLRLTGGRLHGAGRPPSSGVPFQDVLRAAGIERIEGHGQSEGSDADPRAKRHSMHSFGAHFVEVTWEPAIARLRVARVVTVIDAGRIINPRTGRNQIEGAVVMGVGMALLEETSYDSRQGAPVNNNLADYMVATHADAPDIDVHFVEHPDTVLNELGARGIGEIGLAGVAAAITSAVHHATGVRVRDLPVKVETLLQARSAD
ncbi:xanthine dehydrogenase family protein molybdopterin-binding subunit [Pigmentiphaga sp. GD03639]|uniref:xanthine dehydrogenase family protein molybdopterin-binding subunit n=1 Tax=unclassified Pigmentiphaga TaxID=2626614 RepID=UPI00244A74F0|nr:xanthine dehydrogenase family protein molybdopterin-binding subunit [Pigmentiphaga sp. GD03639]MDH2239686.1 xanthine dehydrogenase family protein molybdopterin-binding subunit [Pigmentiphaga sp. GD03639]